MARRGNGALLIFAAALLLVISLPSQDAFVGSQMPQTARSSRVALRARGGEEVREILVTHEPTGMRTRVSVPVSASVKTLKEAGLKSLGMTYDWMTNDEWCFSLKGKSAADKIDESKSVGDADIKKGQEIHVWYSPA